MRFRVVFFSLVVWPLYTSYICREIWESATLKKGGKMHCLGFKYPVRKKNVFSLPTVLCLIHHHIIGLHISLSSREVKTTRPDFYDDLHDDDVFYLPFFFFSLFLSLSLSFCLCVRGNERIQFSDRFLLCVTRWSNFGLKTAAPSFALSHHETTWQRELFSLVATNAHPSCVTLLRRKKE